MSFIGNYCFTLMIMQNCVIFKDSWKGLTSTGFDDFKITSLSCIRMSRTPREKWIHKVANKRSARMNYLKLNKLIRMVMGFALKYCWFFNGLFSRFKEIIFLYSLKLFMTFWNWVKCTFVKQFLFSPTWYLQIWKPLVRFLSSWLL